MGNRRVRELRRFLMERLDEDERFALNVLRSRANDRSRTTVSAGCWQPVRVLAECEAKRRIILEQPEFRRGGWDVSPDTEAADPSVKILKLLALPYAGHPDYDERWRPDLH